MKYFSWNEEKNELLKSERRVSFEDVVFYIEKGFLLDVLDHPNPEKYKEQKILRCRLMITFTSCLLSKTNMKSF
jgi:uncharacterized DUF497 family protein